MGQASVKTGKAAAPVFSDYPNVGSHARPDELRLTARKAEERIPLPILDAVQRAADLREEIGWAIRSRSGSDRRDCILG